MLVMDLWGTPPNRVVDCGIHGCLASHICVPREYVPDPWLCTEHAHIAATNKENE